MNEQQDKKRFRAAIDRTLTSLEGDPFLAPRVMAQAEKGKRKMKIHGSKRMLFALVAVVCIGTIAVAGNVLGGTANWLGEVVLDERVPSVMPTMAPPEREEQVELDEALLDQLRTDGTMLVISRREEDGTITPEMSTRMWCTAENLEAFLALLDGEEEMVLPTFIPEGYIFEKGEVYYECRKGGEWLLKDRQELAGGLISEKYVLDEANELISGYHLLFRSSPEDYHYLSVDARLSERLDVQEQAFGFLAGQAVHAVQIPGMDYALAIVSEEGFRLSMKMLRDLKQPVACNFFWTIDRQEEMTYEQLHMTVSAPLLEVEELVRMFAAE